MSVYGEFEGRDVEAVSASMTGKMTLAKRLAMGEELVIIAAVRCAKVTHTDKNGLERLHVLDAGHDVFELTKDVLERVVEMGGLATPEALIDAARTRIDDLVDEREGRRRLPLGLDQSIVGLYDQESERERSGLEDLERLANEGEEPPAEEEDE